MSLYSLVSRGVAGRFGQHALEDPAPTVQAGAADPLVRFQSASMWVLEAGLALTAIVTAILIGVGR